MTKSGDQNSSRKYTKYGLLQQLLQRHGFNMKLHVSVLGSAALTCFRSSALSNFSVETIAASTLSGPTTITWFFNGSTVWLLKQMRNDLG
ncbi:hypothetical protein CYMTET_3410 [Cymbomonas tetramitiformis]|uniref:Uncharacterized protein n=1 Tax=Cymbomonas tetramitiformis TaxID=36881 RepID=A0AAE0H3E6_9CHLO|nr:hypothetical protein CYMTET_3410 [Cymbomonas tetramitiformis]